MQRLIPALALASALLATAAHAQTVSDDVTKQLWCGTAMVIAFSSPPPDATEEQLAQAQMFIERGNALVDAATQGYLDAGFTQEATDQAKRDIVPLVTEQVTGPGDGAQFTFEECLQVLPELDEGGDMSSSSAPAN